MPQVVGARSFISWVLQVLGANLHSTMLQLILAGLGIAAGPQCPATVWGDQSSGGDLTSSGLTCDLTAVDLSTVVVDIGCARKAWASARGPVPATAKLCCRRLLPLLMVQ